jgi:hypothetical protein
VAQQRPEYLQHETEAYQENNSEFNSGPIRELKFQICIGTQIFFYQLVVQARCVNAPAMAKLPISAKDARAVSR